MRAQLCHALLSFSPALLSFSPALLSADLSQRHSAATRASTAALSPFISAAKLPPSGASFHLFCAAPLPVSPLSFAASSQLLFPVDPPKESPAVCALSCTAIQHVTVVVAIVACSGKQTCYAMKQ